MGQIYQGKARFYRFIRPSEHDPTIETRYKTVLCIEGKEYEIEIVEGENYEPSMMCMYISYGDGFMLIFALNDEQSFEETKFFREKIIQGKGDKNYPIILVGSKLDLENERKVPFNEAKALADSWGMPYIEVSAKNNFNFKESLEILIKNIIKYKSELKKKDDKKKNCIIV